MRLARFGRELYRCRFIWGEIKGMSFLCDGDWFERQTTGRFRFIWLSSVYDVRWFVIVQRGALFVIQRKIVEWEGKRHDS